jgi:cytochrome c oxidase subunit 3
VLTFLLGLSFLLTQVLEYSRIGFAPYTDAFGTIFFCLTGLHGAHVFVGLTLLLAATIRSFRGHYSRRSISVSRSPGSTGTSST